MQKLLPSATVVAERSVFQEFCPWGGGGGEGGVHHRVNTPLGRPPPGECILVCNIFSSYIRKEATGFKFGNHETESNHRVP